jgi:hypothetical protein
MKSGESNFLPSDALNCTLHRYENRRSDRRATRTTTASLGAILIGLSSPIDSRSGLPCSVKCTVAYVVRDRAWYRPVVIRIGADRGDHADVVDRARVRPLSFMPIR